MTKRILVLGSGGREHAILDALYGNDVELFCAPGNAGTAQIAENVDLDITDNSRVVLWVKESKIDLVVVGPEDPLVNGIVDDLSAEGIRVFGPSASAARLEGSKKFAKDFMERHNIPTAGYLVFTEEKSALLFVDQNDPPFVIKADGLASGKGVTIATTKEDAATATRDCFSGRFGESGKTVVIEEYLEGQECSLLAFTDGTTVFPMLTAQGHKRLLDGNRCPNTGGMGVYAPVPSIAPNLFVEMTDILKRTVIALRSEGIVYKGILYGGFILTASGPKVIEYNCRFGDPETQVLLPLFRANSPAGKGFLDILEAVVENRLSEVEPLWQNKSAVSVVMASKGYPEKPESGFPIFGVDEAEIIEGVKVFHAGTTIKEGVLVTNGGRVLNVTAVDETFALARDKAYAAVEKICFDGAQFRTDIGDKSTEL